MTSTNLFFWANVSLESVQRECKRNGDGYKAGYQNGNRGYWITVLESDNLNADGRLAKPTTRRDHRIRSASPLPPVESTKTLPIKKQPLREANSSDKKFGSGNSNADATRRVPSRRLSAILQEELESSVASDSTSIWEGSSSGARLKYTKGELLGRGNFGEVRKVSVEGYTGSVASKSMFFRSSNKQHVRKEKERIQREVENLQRARHKHVVSILDCYSEQEKNFTTYFLIMSPVGNQDLETLLGKYGGMSLPDQDRYRRRVSRWFICLASALAYLHIEGIRHEDIKPSNIIHRGDTVYFTDFSSSRVFESDFETSATSTVQTSRRFAAPEVLDRFDDEIHKKTGNAVKVVGKDGKTTYKVPHGRQSDVFSLGLVFAEMTTVFNKTITEMHDFVLTLEESRKQPLYHEVVDRLGTWFTKKLESERSLKLWQCCLRAMLKTKRTSRPSALEVVHILQREKPLSTVTDDGCQALLSRAPTTKIQKPQAKRQGVTILEDTRMATTGKGSEKADRKTNGTNKTELRRPDVSKVEDKASGVGATRETRAEKDRTPKKKDDGAEARKSK